MSIASLIHLLLNMDTVLPQMVNQYHNLVYVILFFIIFSETGFVVTPFLPGDSLIFASATLAAAGQLNPYILLPLLLCASVCGDNVNYTIGDLLSEKVQSKQNLRLIKREYIERTHKFYEKHGPAAVIIAKFMPIIRTFSPFVAGVGSMTRRKFFLYDLAGGFLWVGLFACIGYLFGQHPFVKEHFSMVVIGIVLISVSPAVILFLRQKFFKKSAS